MKWVGRTFLLMVGWAALSFPGPAQNAPQPKRLLLIGEEKGYRHEAVSHAMATIERLGRETGLWTTTIRTDTEALTKKKLEYNAKNLNDFDAVMFYTGGELEMNAEQKAALLALEEMGVMEPSEVDEAIETIVEEEGTEK